MDIDSSLSRLMAGNAYQGDPTRAAVAIGRDGAAASEDQLRSVTSEFESIFVKMLLDSMRSTVNRENLLVDGGIAQDIYEDMLYTEYSQLIAKTGDFGIADVLYRQFTRADIVPADSVIGE